MKLGERIERWIRPEIRALKAYGVADPGDLVKLDAMENPYPWPGEVRQRWLEKLATVEVNRYPDPQARILKSRLREAMGVPREQELLLGNGSDEIIQLIVCAVARPGARILVPGPTFVMYDMIARFMGVECITVPLQQEDFSLDAEAMLAAIEKHDPAVTFLAYPNNPTGNLFERSVINDIIEAQSGLVIIDEAYHAFASRTYMDQLGAHDNVLVMRTVSKLGLAGLRLGLLAGEAAWLQEFDKVRLPYNINTLTQASAEFVLAEQDFLTQQTRAIIDARRQMYEQLDALDGVQVWPSEANFILFRCTGRTSDEIHEGLKRAGVLIKNLGHADALLKDCLRVTVGTPEENRVFLGALSRLL